MNNVYLAHHGVKGMRWGVWNDETRARRLGYRDIDRMMKGSTSREEAVSKIKQQMGDLRSEKTKFSLKRMDTAAKELNSSGAKIGVFDPEDTEVFQKAQNRAAENYIKSELKNNGKYYPPNSRARMKLEEFAYIEVGYDAGKKAFEKAYPKYVEAEKAFNNAFNEYYNNLKSDVDSLVNTTGDRKINNSEVGDTYKSLVMSVLDDFGKDDRKRWSN